MNAEDFRRREVLALLGAGALAGCSGLPGLGGEGGPAGGAIGGSGGDAPTEPVGEERARALAERFAPTLYFDTDETWFPTDPRPYAGEQDGRKVVHGFDAVDGYLRRFDEEGSPPDPTVFYNARTYVDSPLSVVQFWLYSTFDQFTTNFHWHDWEVLHAFVDDDTDGTQLYVASSHSRRVPNNEFLDPQNRPRILSELGSHSSAVSLNAHEDSFQRLPGGGTFADITNVGIDTVKELVEFPVAYGLPRDEGFRLPYVVPELDGAPVYEHPDLPHFERSHLVPPELTVDSYDDLARPPTGLPTRQTGTTFGHAGQGSFDLEYALVPTTELEAIEAFTGPQLSFSFTVPGFVEDAIADHITTAGTPWTQDRYRNPAADISDPNHRATLADRYDAVGAGGPAARLVGVIREAVPDEDAPDGEGVKTTDPTVETVALVESEPEAVPSFAGVVVADDVPPGEHRLTVNGAGRAPYTERVRADGTTAVGVDGQVGMVANADAVKLRVDTEGTDDDLREFGVADDFGGPLYGTRLDGPAAVYVHGGGAYTAEVRDAEDVPGAFRVNPDADSDSDEGDDSDGGGASVTIERPRTGKASLAEFVASVSADSRTTVKVAVDVDVGVDVGNGSLGLDAGVKGLLTALEAVQTAATDAVERAEAGDRGAADQRLRAVRTRLSKTSDALENARGDLPAPAARAVELRVDQARTRTDQALNVEKL